MPWKCIVCGWSEPLTNLIRSRSPSRQRSVGPGMRPLKVQAGKLTPGATSISLSLATTSHSRSVRPRAAGAYGRVEVAQDFGGVEAVGRMVDGLARAERGPVDPAAVAGGTVPGRVVRVVPDGPRIRRLEQRPRADDGAHRPRAPAQETPPGHLGSHRSGRPWTRPVSGSPRAWRRVPTDTHKGPPNGMRSPTSMVTPGFMPSSAR